MNATASLQTPDARDLADAFDIQRLDPSFYADPYPTYRALREHDPVKRLPNGSVFLTRYADLVAVYKDTQRYSSDKREEFGPKYAGIDGTSPLFAHHTTSLVFNDPPLHTRVRRLIAGALTPKHIAAMEPALIARVEYLLDAMEQRARRGESIDLIEDYASAIPIEIIGNLLAIPQADRAPLRDWSLAILGALEPVLTPHQQALGNAAVTEFIAYLVTLIAERTAHPGDPEVDVLSRLIAGEGGERLTADELLHNCIFLLNAGHETTTNLIGNGLVALHAWPEQKARLIGDPILINKAVEEVLRYESSNQLGNRITTEAVEIGGVALAPRTPVHLCIGAANRDPEQFVDPERLDIGRAPNRHLAFGSGPHQCVGLALARLEGRIAVARFIERFPGYRLDGEPTRGGRARFRGFLHVPARLG
ncbi:MAG: cytochrome P450 [Burkholderiaceae bacterium]